MIKYVDFNHIHMLICSHKIKEIEMQTKPVRISADLHKLFFLDCVKREISMTQKLGELISAYLSEVEEAQKRTS